MRFKCCDKYYACIHCHNECEDHEPIPWSKDEQDTLAVMCGVCKYEMTIREYVNTDQCPNCSASFNPRCEAYYPYYFTLLSVCLLNFIYSKMNHLDVWDYKTGEEDILNANY